MEAVAEPNPVTFRTALVAMPFVDIYRPSIQLGLLHASLLERNIASQSFHLYLDFAHRIGLNLYNALAEHRGPQFGEWLFAAEAFGPDTPVKADHFLEDFATPLAPLLESARCDSSRLEEVRREIVPRFIQDMLDAIEWNEFSIVGFTSTFQQNVASFALARRLKERFPHIKTVFGGANFDGEMGLEWIRKMPFIDFVVVGEGDDAFPALLQSIRDGQAAHDIPGVISRNADGTPELKHPSRPVADLNASPVPDYDDFFERFESLGFGGMSAAGVIMIPFESARGCWWGQKSHCTFCGLNGQTMKFRSKKPERVMEELQCLASRYGVFQFSAVDNIMDFQYFTTFLEKLKSSRADYRIFYEIKSNVGRVHIKALADAGVAWVQPGIESLNSTVLRLMKKGVRAIQNVNLLRWARYYQVCVSWNILWGFPGETELDYESQVTLIPSLVHLQPPLAVGRIRMERFSPIFQDRATFRAEYVHPETSYSYVYPNRVDLDRAAYFFDYKFTDSLDDRFFEKIRPAVDAWKKAWRGRDGPSLTFSYSPGMVRITDCRFGEQRAFQLTGDLAEIYLTASDEPATARRLSEKLQADSGTDIQQVLEKMCENGLMMKDQDFYLSLALPATPGR